ncbi:hypothetical protein [Haloquadratum walsbyi]|uniref:SHOCT domain-containing protein n=1 Tax=Haloquadratum walsbyi (strain DSM 16790 / HBSQ001) TaxID=362976 RepID=Q18DV5_HALWD|nr:hypothetical protein [Haloquadratum walsbyi]CAJ51272.1 uncharacterized protein HQ_1142A [Haloquadratum walsbyi DSM 16790]
MIMSEHSARLLWVALFGIVLSIGLSALTTVYLIIAITSGIITATPLAELVVDVAIPAIIALGVFSILWIASVMSLLWALFQWIMQIESYQLATVFARVEEIIPPISVFHLPARFTPMPASIERDLSIETTRALASLRRQYVIGDISDATFERRMERLLMKSD